MNPLSIAGVVVIGLLTVALTITGKLYQGAVAGKARVEGEYSAFRTGVERAGKAQEAKNRETVALQEKINVQRLQGLQDRYAAASARADGLCKSAGLSSGCRELPPIPETARPVDDSTHDQRLLAVLRHAQDTTDKLIELQAWVADQATAK